MVNKTSFPKPKFCKVSPSLQRFHIALSTLGWVVAVAFTFATATGILGEGVAAWASRWLAIGATGSWGAFVVVLFLAVAYGFSFKIKSPIFRWYLGFLGLIIGTLCLAALACACQADAVIPIFC